MRTPSEAWKREFRKVAIEPQIVVAIAVPERSFVRIKDYTLLSGATLTITVGGVDCVFQETASPSNPGEWTATGSNGVTAQNLRDAILDHPWFTARLVSWVKEYATTPDIQITLGNLYAASGMTVVSSVTAGMDQVASSEDVIGLKSGSANPFDDSWPWAMVPCISHAKWKGRELDDIARTVSTETVSITILDDGYLRARCVDIPFRDLTAEVYIGCDELADFDDWLLWGTYRINDLQRKEDGIYILDIADRKDALTEVDVVLAGTGAHPLTHMHGILSAAGYPSDWYDATSLDPSSYTEISHHSVSRYNEPDLQRANAVNDKTNARSLFDELLALVGGTWRPTPAGVDTFIAFDLDASSVRSWDANGGDPPDSDRVSVSPLDPDGSIDNAINSGQVNFCLIDNELQATYKLDENYSLSQLGRVAQITLDTKWLNAYSQYIYDSALPGNAQKAILDTSTSFEIRQACRHGYSGCLYHLVAGGWTRDSGAALYDTSGMGNPERWAYYRLEGNCRVEYAVPPGPYVVTSEPEVIAIGDITVADPYAHDNLPGWGDVGPERCRVHFAVGSPPAKYGFTNGRGGMGTTTPYRWGLTTPADPSNSILPRLVDITVAVHLLESRFDRYAYGAPTVTLFAPLTELVMEIGDVGTIYSDEFSAYRLDGIGADQTWEVKLVEPMIWNDTPGVKIVATLLKNSAAPEPYMDVPQYTWEIPPPNIGLRVEPIFTVDEVLTDDSLNWLYPELGAGSGIPASDVLLKG